MTGRTLTTGGVFNSPLSDRTTRLTYEVIDQLAEAAVANGNQLLS
jgi:hypothetical protein